MEFLGIGPVELLVIVLIALIVLGPKDMVKTGRMVGRLLRKLFLWQPFMAARRWMRSLPTELMREAGLEDLDLNMDELRDLGNLRNLESIPTTPARKPPAGENIAGPVDEIPPEWITPQQPDPAAPPPPTQPDSEASAG